MNKQKAREWALELSGRQGPTDIGIQREVFARAGSQAERHQLLGLMQQARGDDEALTKLAEWILRAPVALSEKTDSDAWQNALRRACRLAGRCQQRQILMPSEEDDIGVYDKSTIEKIKALADSARTDEESLKQLARALYSLDTGHDKAPSLAKVNDVSLWLKALESTNNVVSPDRQKAAKRLKHLFPNLPSAKFSGLLDVIERAEESAQAYDLLSVEIYRLFEEKYPAIEIPEGYHDTSTVKLAEDLTKGMRRARGLSERTTNTVIALRMGVKG